MATKKNQKNIPKMNKTEDTDPQDHMEGPVSSLVQDVKEAVKDNDDEKKEDADKKKDSNT